MAVSLPSYQPNVRPSEADAREDDMRRTHIPAVLLFAACAAAGCSKRAEAPDARTPELPVPAAVKPAPVPEAVDQKPAEGSGAAAPAKIAGPVNHVKSLVHSSRVLIDHGRTDEALVHLTRAGELAPGSAEVQRLFGRAYAAQHKSDEAADAYRRAIALDPDDAWSMNNLGLLLLEQHRAEEALPLLCRAVHLRMDVAAFHNNLGMALEHTGRFLAAAEEYRGAVTADAGYGKAKQNLARVEAVKVGHEEPFDLEAVATVGR